ncbi:Bcr/CflA family multidrug efflux MFS transporter [Stella sp.]|uniref:Bcr/CflA family multidrug efflux MFS transporter n=1 Tax=Stella sp. TaxID=2912054 RepID=UPI0035B0E86A
MRPPKTELLVILGALTAFAPLSIDMYLPAFPQMEVALGASTDAIQRTLAAFFLGFALGQASYGPVTDRFGRKPPLYFGLGLYVLASIGCALAPSAEALTVLRFVQAVGACSGMVIARAMVRDLFEPRDAARAYSSLMLVTGLAPILAPVIGGAVLVWSGWTTIFWLLAGYAVLALAAVHWRLPETHPADPSRPLAFGRAVVDYARILRDRRYMGYAAGGGLGMAGMFAYIAGSPFVFIDLHGVTAQQYGWVFGLNAIGFVAAAQVNGRLLPAGSHERALRVAMLVQGAAALLLIAAGATGTGGFAGLFAPIFVYVACLGFIMPNAAALAMAPYGRNAGVASALLGTLQFSLAAVASALVGLLHDGSALPMAGTVAAFGLAGLAVNRLLAPAPPPAMPR